MHNSVNRPSDIIDEKKGACASVSSGSTRIRSRDEVIPHLRLVQHDLSGVLALHGRHVLVDDHGRRGVPWRGSSIDGNHTEFS